jgi:DNA polymerase-3 subunit alpha
MEGLVCSGAFDSLKSDESTTHHWRARNFAAIDVGLARSARSKRAKAMGQDDLFGGEHVHAVDTASDLPMASAWTASEMLAAEKKCVGFYVTGHPLEAHFELVSKLGAVSSAELSQQETGSRATIAGLITDLQLRTTKKGDRFAIFRLEDQAGSIKCVLWPEPFRRQSGVVIDDATVLVNGRLEVSDDGAVTVFAERLTELTQAEQQKAREMVIRIPTKAEPTQLCEAVRTLLEHSRGDCEVFIEVLADGMLVRVRAHPSLKVQGSREIESAVRKLGCEVRWEGFAVARQAAAAQGSA